MVYERKKAYAEVDTVLQCLPNEYLDKIPKKITNFFKTHKLNDYKFDIDKNNPIDKNKLSEMALSILAMLNYQYWCPNETIKLELTKQYVSNNEKYKKKIEEKYSVTDLFNASKNEVKVEEKQSLVKYEKKIFIQKILNNIIKLFKRK